MTWRKSLASSETTRASVLGGEEADFNAGNGMKEGTQSTQVFIQRVFTEHQLLPTLCPAAEDRSVDPPGRKQGKREWGRGQGSRRAD